MKSRLVGFAAIFFIVLAGNLSARVWTDKTGKHRVEADFVSLDGESVTLRKKDGSTVSLPLDRLSEDDASYARGEAGEARRDDGGRTAIFVPSTAAGAKKIAQRKTEAKEVLELYQEFLKSSSPTEEDKATIRDEIDSWRERAKGDRVRLGKSWVTRDEHRTAERNSADLILQAIHMIRAQSLTSAKEKLAAASRTNPEDFRADFIMGLVHAISNRDADDAEKSFEESTKRLSPTIREHSTLDAANYGATLNNLALAELRNKRFGEAVRHWEESAEACPHSLELVQNLGRFLYLVERHDAKHLMQYRSRVSDTFGKLSTLVRHEVFQESVGWLYMNFATSSEGAPAAGQRPAPTPVARGRNRLDSLRVVGSGTGFVVANDYILTNRHVASAGDQFEIYLGHKNSKLATIKHIQPAPKEDLALIHCPGLGLPPVSLADEVPKRGTELLVLGFPSPTTLGFEIKATRGIVTSLPREDNGMFTMDATVNGGNSGGPASDRRGNVIGVVTAINNRAALQGNTYSYAVPANKAREYVAAHLPSIPSPLSSATAMEWPDLDALISKSTVMIICMQSTARNGFEGADGESAPPPRRPNGSSAKSVYEDYHCVHCYGKIDLKCPNSCAKGVKTLQTRQQIGTNPNNGAPVMGIVPSKVRCTTCGGDGVVRCKNCVQGMDKDLFNAKVAAIVASQPRQRVELTHWLNTKSDIRHNSRCQFYGVGDNGRRCTEDEGFACSRCGG